MRNILMVVALLCAMSVLTCEQAHAGGGKTTKKGRVEVKNTNAGGGRTITVWVVPEGTALPTTVGEARKIQPQKNVAAMKTESFSVNPGNYTMVAADTTVYNNVPDNTPIDATVIAINSPIVVNDTVKRNVKTVGATPFFKPEITP